MRVLRFVIGVAMLFVIASSVNAQVATVPLYQLLYTPRPGQPPGWLDYFHTISVSQRDTAIAGGYVTQGVACEVSAIQITGTTPLFRLYYHNTSTGRRDHFYTTSASERSQLTGVGWKYEGVEGYVYASRATGTVPLYRLYHQNHHAHFYTVEPAQRDAKVGAGWRAEGVAAYCFPSASLGGSGGAAVEFWADYAHATATLEYGTVTSNHTYCVAYWTGGCRETYTLQRHRRAVNGAQPCWSLDAAAWCGSNGGIAIVGTYMLTDEFEDPGGQIRKAIYPGEARADGWGFIPVYDIAPGSADQRWHYLMPPGRRFGTQAECVEHATRAVPGIVCLVNTQYLIPTGKFIAGGGHGPTCPTCTRFGSRVAYTCSVAACSIFVTGVCTGSRGCAHDLGVYKNTIRMYNGGGFTPEFKELAYLATQLKAQNKALTIVGHSLGAAEVTALYNYRVNGRLLLTTYDTLYALAPPEGVPSWAMKQSSSPARYTAYIGTQDLVVGGKPVADQRRAQGVPVIDLETGQGYPWNAFGPHDRNKYQMNVFGIVVF